jgi:hypothetical protein
MEARLFFFLNLKGRQSQEKNKNHFSAAKRSMSLLCLIKLTYQLFYVSGERPPGIS